MNDNKDDNHDIYFNDRRVSETLHVVLNQLQDVTRQVAGSSVLLDSLYIDALAHPARMAVRRGDAETQE